MNNKLLRSSSTRRTCCRQGRSIQQAIVASGMRYDEMDEQGTTRYNERKEQKKEKKMKE